MKDKLNLIFKPFLLALVGLTVIYTLLHWLLFIKLNLFSLKEIVTNFGTPIVLAGLVAWFLLRPKLKILNLEAKRGSWRDFYTFIVLIALTVPLIIAQEYIVTATGKLVELNSIKDINNFEPAKYYTLKSRYIHKQAIGVHSAFDVSGRHNENLNMHIYVVMPIFESLKDTLANETSGWLGIEYNQTISNKLDENKKEAAYQEFANKSQNDLDAKNVYEFVYLDRIGNSDDKDGYMEAIKQNSMYKPNETIFIGVNELFTSRNGKKLEWILGSAFIGSLVWLIMLLIPKIDERQLERIKAGKPDKVAQKEMLDFLGFLKPGKGYFITPILMYLNIAIFLLMAIGGLGFITFKGQDLLNLGANYRPLILSGEWWRLLTSVFLHGGLMHVLANMYGLLFIGAFLEPLLGRVRYLSIYLITGILASVASIWWHEATVSIGASGAIFGLSGVFVALLLTKVYPADFAKSFLISMSIYIGYSLLMGLTGGIDNAAHIGGLLSGFVIGLILSPGVKRRATDDKNEDV